MDPQPQARLCMRHLLLNHLSPLLPFLHPLSPFFGDVRQSRTVNPDWLRTCSNPPASASLVLVLQVCRTTSGTRQLPYEAALPFQASVNGLWGFAL